MERAENDDVGQPVLWLATESKGLLTVGRLTKVDFVETCSIMDLIGKSEVKEAYISLCRLRN